MNQSEFRLFWENFNADAEVVMFSKMNDYARTEDQLANFKVAAEHLGLTPQQVWGVYYYKHVASIMTLAGEGKVESEPPRQRFIDLLNYAILGAALFSEAESAAVPQVESPKRLPPGPSERELHDSRGELGEWTEGEGRRKTDSRTAACRSYPGNSLY